MSHLSTLTAVIACLSLVKAAILPKRGLSFDYDNDRVRGVNLGGWFVLEPWITPSLFEAVNGAVDEYTYCQILGSGAQGKMNDHWNSWITQADFNEIASVGLNHVRIPIGYWAINPLPGDPYVQGQLPILDNAIEWARGAGLKVMLDLHGAPGSQNGFDNSGHYGPIGWQQGDTTSQTLTALQSLADRYKGATDVVTAIELLNEPMGPVLDQGRIKKFYYDGWGNVRNSNSETVVVIHDAFFDPVQYWNGFMGPGSGVNNVMIDHHNYQIFSDGEVAMSPSDHISAACASGPNFRQSDKWLVIGEWTGAQTDCAKWLNGLGKGARYDGSFEGSSYHGSCDGKYTGSAAALSNDDKFNLRHYVEAQLDAYEQRSGWIFWAWKTESAPEWNFQDLVHNGLIPQPLTSRQYPGQCGY